MTKPLFETPEAAERAFYQALCDADLQALKDVWLDDDTVICITPGFQRMEGVEMVLSGWKQVFQMQGGVRFDLTDMHVMQDEQIAIHQIREEIFYQDQASAIMLTTNVYQFVNSSWRLMLHHSSPEPETPEDDLDDTQIPIVFH